MFKSHMSCFYLQVVLADLCRPDQEDLVFLGFPCLPRTTTPQVSLRDLKNGIKYTACRFLHCDVEKNILKQESISASKSQHPIEKKSH